MTIVHLVLGKANPERANGVNRVAHGLATAQARAGTAVEVWGITRTPAAPTSRREYALRLFAAARSPWRLDPALIGAPAELPDASVVHLHGGWHPEFHAAARVLRARSMPWVLTPHGAYRTAVLRKSWLRKRAYLALVERALLCDAHAVQVFSERERDELLRLVPRVNAVVLANGVDLAELDVPRASAAPVEHRSMPVFGFCGRLASHTKGLDLLLDGFALHASRGGTGELHLIGAGERALLEALATRRGIADRVRFLGELFGPEKLAAMRATDVFLHPSRHEGMPTAVLEAAALGLPCVLSRETNLAEPFERAHAGLVLDPNDTEHVARSLARCVELHACGELALLGRNARDLVEREFTWDALAARARDELYPTSTPAGSRAA